MSSVMQSASKVYKIKDELNNEIDTDDDNIDVV